ncbi:MAG: capsule assembly Wzi family protein, partial [Candidatus Zixiibacteriota bacterium]
YYNYQLGPYSNNENHFSFSAFSYLQQIPSTELVLFSFAGEEFSSVKDNHANGFESFRGGIAASPHDNIFVFGNFILDERKAEDAGYTGKKWRGFAGGVEDAFVYYKSGSIDILVGRFASFWGPRHSLALSSRNSMDGFEYTFHWGRLALSYRLAKLDRLKLFNDITSATESSDLSINRYFAGHRLDIFLSKKLRIGFYETIIFGGAGRQLDLYYLNPIIFFHSYQLNQDLNDNTFLGFDFTFKPKPGIKFYGQFLVDDFQIDKKTQADQEPNQYGLIIGTHFIDVAPSFDIKLEYNRITNRTFNQILEHNRYQVNNRLISGAFGNDYDLILVTLNRWFNDHLTVSLVYSYMRQGEGQVTDDWTEPWFDIEGDYSEPFPTGIVERTNGLSIGVKGFAFNHFFFDIETGLNKINNYRHIDTDNRSLPFIKLNISTFLSSSLNVDK